MTHIEDKVLYGGVKERERAINALRNIRDMLAGKSSTKMSVKWDGHQQFSVKTRLMASSSLQRN